MVLGACIGAVEVLRYKPKVAGSIPVWVIGIFISQTFPTSLWSLGSTQPLIEVSYRGENCVPLGYNAPSLIPCRSQWMSPVRRADNRDNFMPQSSRNWDTPPPLAPRSFPGLYRYCNWHWSSESGHLGRKIDRSTFRSGVFKIPYWNKRLVFVLMLVLGLQISC